MNSVIVYEDMIGETLVSVEVSEDYVVMRTNDEDYFYGMQHYQECCESVWLEDVNGDVDDLVGTPILLAEKVTQEVEDKDGTWTFIKLGTIKGTVTFRWCGVSNGYYSEDADIGKIKTEKKRKEEREEYLRNGFEKEEEWALSLFN